MMLPRAGFVLFGVTVGAAIVAAALQPAPSLLEEAQKRDLVHKIHNELAAGQALYSLAEVPGPAVRFEVEKPQNAAESACSNTDGRLVWEIRVNESFAAAHYREYLRETVPHEVAHLLLCQLGQEWHGHGTMWATIVRDMGATPHPTHDYNEE